jgi:chromosome segregation ATPase
MTMQNTLEEKIQSTDRRVKEILEEVEKTSAELDLILEELEATPGDLEEFFADPLRFSALEWEEIESEKKKLDEHLDCEMDNVRDPAKVRKKFAENGHVQQHWLFVR